MRTVADVMHAPPVVVEPGTSLQEASARMLDARVHAAVVVEGGRLRGIATAEGVARALAEGRDAATTPVAAITAGDVRPAGADEPLAEVHERMRMRGEAFLPVIAGGEAVGVLHDDEAGDARF